MRSARSGAPAKRGSPVSQGAPGVRGIVSAMASNNDRSRPSASGSRSSWTGAARAAAGMASARARTRSMSAMSYGPTRHASTPLGETPGRIRPRATRCNATLAAAA
ncbi:hypothetical protein [Actinokineospora globicatena]|uniref:hypothetical protein n=1 Tax=Actinokineospora globicatena TaxID=103729 RepID=UPI002554B8BA|nr:hypothetical protein [Actinokineospora globicatena]